MFIISLHYTAPLEQLDAYMTEHVQFLNTHYKQHIFLTSGRKVPRTGGIILARAESKEKLAEIMAGDPFCKHGLAEVTITEFLNSQMHPAFKKMM
ncbi:MAG TPA: YciI family protein, partial [Cyclobacteriaceae bacterium]|nr:YciI family protein [Cyclobacteriaceae bacterium]